MENLIDNFLRKNSSGDGSGYGYGSGSGSGSGDGDGSGDGSGYGYGSGYGSDYGDGYILKKINSKKIYYIDEIPCVFLSIHGLTAKVEIIDKSFNKKKAFIIKGYDMFAHGNTIRDAQKNLENKYLSSLSTDNLLDLFVEKFNVYECLYNIKDLFKWHGFITGSCEFGRELWIKENEINIDDKITIKDFIHKTQNAFGGQIIQKLKKLYKNV